MVGELHELDELLLGLEEVDSDIDGDLELEEVDVVVDASSPRRSRLIKLCMTPCRILLKNEAAGVSRVITVTLCDSSPVLAADSGLFKEDMIKI